MFIGNLLNSWGAPPLTAASSQYFYEVLTPPAILPVTLSQIKTHIIYADPSYTGEDDYLTLLAKSATLKAEEYTGRTLINTQFVTYRNNFLQGFFTLLRSRFQSLTSIQYLSDNTYQTVDPSIYYINKNPDYSSILPAPDKYWPTNIDNKLSSIKITFTAGYGSLADDVPSDIKIAILNHVAFLYENRGDCSCSPDLTSLPATSRAVYDLYRIRNINGNLYC